MVPQENKVSILATDPTTEGTQARNNIREELEPQISEAISRQSSPTIVIDDPLPTAALVHPSSLRGHNSPIQAGLVTGLGVSSQLSDANEPCNSGGGGVLHKDADLEPNYRTELSEQIISTAESSSEPRDPHSQMARALRDSFISSADGEKFLPLNQLKTIVTEAAVQSVLNKTSTTQPLIAGDICNTSNNRTQTTFRQKIFATLVLIGKVELIGGFIKENITDAELPFEERGAGASTFLVTRGTTSDPAPTYALRQAPGGWTCNDIPLFCQQQWAVSVPYFAGAEAPHDKVNFYSLSPNDILPFVKPGTDDRGDPAFLNQGFFSTVRRVKIHEAHHNFPVLPGHDGADFAVKKITRVHDRSAESHKECFDLEVEALEKFCQKTERYIIKLLATYEVGGVYHLLFPVADGNLMDLWKDTQRGDNLPADQPEAGRWLVQECLGIGQALGKIHQCIATPALNASPRSSEMPIHGIHGDIKPQNVLWFKELPGHLQGTGGDSQSSHGTRTYDLGHLQLSDFGTVYFHRAMSVTDNVMPVTGLTYRAPETDSPTPQGSPAIDIWAFGCLYLDIITWFLCGLKAVDESFPSARTQDELEPLQEGVPKQDTFYISSTGWFSRKETQVVKPSVVEWIDQLHRKRRCSQFLHDFLDFIEERMLVVSPSNRATCTEVVRKLEWLEMECDKEAAYHEAGKPRGWTSSIFSCLPINRMLKNLGRIAGPQGQMISILIVVVAFLVWIFTHLSDLA